jgi:hypothetical protein
LPITYRDGHPSRHTIERDPGPSAALVASGVRNRTKKSSYRPDGKPHRKSRLYVFRRIMLGLEFRVRLVEDGATWL